MAGPFVVNDFEIAAQAEVTYDTEPDAPVGGDMSRWRTAFPFKRELELLDRDQDMDNSSSVHTTQPGRESSTWELEGAVIPAGSTPTSPDAFEFYLAAMGSQHTMTTNTSTTTGSTGTAINLATGGVSASGIAVGDFFAADVSAAVGVEVRVAAALPGADTVTASLAFTTDPASGRTVYGSSTFALLRSAEKTLQIYSFLGNNFREKVGGAIVSDMEISCDFTGGASEAMVKFSGAASRIAAHTNSRPTPTLAGQPLVIDAAYIWLGSNKLCMTNMALKFNNGLELRNNESCSMYPTGTKRTGNGGKYNAELEFTALLQTGTIADIFDNADVPTAYVVHIQLGKTAGKILGIYAPKFVAKAEIVDVGGQPAVKATGRLYGNGTDDTEFRLGFC